MSSPHHERDHATRGQHVVSRADPRVVLITCEQMTYNGNPRADLSNLSDNELDQLKTALQVVEEAAPQA